MTSIIWFTFTIYALIIYFFFSLINTLLLLNASLMLPPFNLNTWYGSGLEAKQAKTPIWLLVCSLKLSFVSLITFIQQFILPFCFIFNLLFHLSVNSNFLKMKSNPFPFLICILAYSFRSSTMEKQKGLHPSTANTLSKIL